MGHCSLPILGSLINLGLFKFPVHSGTSFGTLYFSRNFSISSFFFFFLMHWCVVAQDFPLLFFIYFPLFTLCSLCFFSCLSSVLPEVGGFTTRTGFNCANLLSRLNADDVLCTVFCSYLFNFHLAFLSLVLFIASGVGRLAHSFQPFVSSDK